MPEPAQPLQMQLSTVLGPQLRFRSMSALEEVSGLFEFRVMAVSDSPSIAADELLSTPAVVSIEVADDKKRWFHGIVASFGIDGVDGASFSYRLTLRPWLWLLTRSSNIRIFQDQSTLEIVQAVFSAYAHHVVDETTGSYATRTYCVQYRESDFNFVSRLLEEEGIYYFFRHFKGLHELVLADAPLSITTVPGFDDVPYLESANLARHVSGLAQWRMLHEVQAGRFTLADYNFETPSTRLLTTPAQTTRQHGEAAREHYDYPGLHLTKAAGDARASIRIEELASRFARFSGNGNVPAIATGTRFTLFNHPRDDLNIEYMVLQTHIDMQQAGYESGSGDTRFACSLLAQPYSEPYRPERRTAKPHVGGLQTARVVGSGGDGAIHTDEHGRVKVQFHWDRLGQKDAQSSCWMRVASQWAGNGWGMISLPRIGQEVVVAFLEGDPDQPLVVGSVHNAEQKPPYALPDNATVSTLKSRSRQGGASDFNEFRFDDKPGSEYVLMHAQKDRLEFVEQTLKAETGKDEHRTIKGKRKEKVEDTADLHVVGAVKQRFDDKLHQKVGGNMLFDGGGLWSLKTASDFTVDSGASVSFKSGTALHLKIGTDIGAEGGQNVHVKGGMNIVIEGGVQVTIKAGSSSIVLGPDGVSITGASVKINSGGSPGSGAGASPVAPTAPDPAEDPEVPVDPLSHR